jgi:ABC-type transporter Mla MlaB component
MAASAIGPVRCGPGDAHHSAPSNRPVPPRHALRLSTSRRDDQEAVNLWVASALRRGERAVCLFDPADTSAEQLSSQLVEAGTAGAAIASGDVLLVDAATVRSGPGGASGAHLAELVRRFGTDARPVNLTADESALRSCLPDGQQLDEFERDLDRLTERSSLRALCRYRAGAAPPRGVTRVHHRAVLDHLAEIEWAGDTLRLIGEIDLSNLARLRTLLQAALDGGVRRLDLSGLQFCCVAGVAAIVEIASISAGAADHAPNPDGLVLIDPPHPVRRIIEFIHRN